MATALLAPLIATLIAGSFSASLLGQYRVRRRHHALAWGISLALFAIGTLSIALGIGLGWNPVTFGAYWVTGGLLTVPFLAVGQLHLLAPRLAALWWTFAGLFTFWALFAIASSPMDPTVFRAIDAAGGIPEGSRVFAPGAMAMTLLPFSNYTAIIVVAGSLWSGLRTRRWGILLIALGVLVAGASFAFVRAGQGELVSVFLALGVGLMYGGFLAAARPARRSATRSAVRPADASQ